MQWFHWLGWILFGILAVVYISFQRYSANMRNSMAEYVQFLFFHPEVYRNHRKKFIAFLKDQTETDLTRLAMVSYEALDQIAQTVRGEISQANVLVRLDPSKVEEKE